MPQTQLAPGTGGQPLPVRLRRWFADDRLFWRLCTAIFCVFACLKGLRAPGDWPLTQAQLDYSHGFIKRGLQGAFLDLLHIHRLHPLSTYFFVQLAVLFLLLILFTRRSGAESRFDTLAPIAVFATSYAVTFLTHIVGYTDIPLATLLVALLLVRNPRMRFWSACVALPIAVLVHESFLVMFLPVLLVSFVLDAAMADGPERKRILIYAVLLTALSLAVTLAASSYPRLSQPVIDQFDDEIQARVDFDIRDDVFNVLSRPLSGSLKEAWDGLSYPIWWVADVVTLVNLLPVVLLLGYFIRRLLKAGLPAARQPLFRRLWAALLLAMLCPLAMYLLGVDGGRWNTSCTLIAFLELLLLCRTLPSAPLRLSSVERNVIVFVMALNMASGMGLFDGEHIHPYPFLPAISEEYR